MQRQRRATAGPDAVDEEGRRRDDPLKSWKLTDEDWRNRERRPEYEAAIEEMLERTGTEHAPWHPWCVCGRLIGARAKSGGTHPFM